MIALLLACAAPEPELEVCDNPDDARIGIMTRITVARFEGDQANGFDLDGKDGDGSDCGLGDFTNDEGVPGIDNALSRLMPALETTEAAALEDILQEAINNGLFLLSWELTSYDDPEQDGCVDVGVSQAAGVPVVGGHGTLLSGQTYERTGEESWVDEAEIVDGRVVAAPFDLTLPVSILDADIILDISEGAIQVDLEDDGTATGVLGGAVPIESILSVLNEDGIDPAVADAVTGLLYLAADMDVDGDGECTDLSLALEFESVNAFYFDD